MSEYNHIDTQQKAKTHPPAQRRTPPTLRRRPPSFNRPRFSKEERRIAKFLNDPNADETEKSRIIQEEAAKIRQTWIDSQDATYEDDDERNLETED